MKQLHMLVPIPKTTEDAGKYAHEYYKTNRKHHLLCLGIADPLAPHGMKVLSVNGLEESTIFAAYLLSILSIAGVIECAGSAVVEMDLSQRNIMDNVLRRLRLYKNIGGRHVNIEALRDMVNAVRKKDGGKGIVVVKFDESADDDPDHPYLCAAEEALKEKQDKKKAA